MIVRDHGTDELLLIDQDDHARMCGALAAHYRPRPSESLVLAANEHDNGWREWDRRPVLDTVSGRPFNYTNTPGAPYAAIWRRGIARSEAFGDLVALLVSLHGMRFFEPKITRGDRHADERALYASERKAQDARLARMGYASSSWEDLPEAVALDYGLMRYFDAFSLFLAENWGSPHQAACPMGPCILARDASGEREHPRSGVHVESPVTAHPFTFEAPFILEAPARVIKGRKFTDQEALDDAVSKAEVVTLRWSVSPARVT